MIIGSNLRRLRKERHMKQEVLAELAGMSQSNISNIEQNKQPVTEEQMQLFAKILEIDPVFLMQTGRETESSTSPDALFQEPNRYFAPHEEISLLKMVIKSQKDEIIFLRNQLIVQAMQIEALRSQLSGV